jgi:ubiquinone/menaquinone biosynthesis C-methylase UbiE
MDRAAWLAERRATVEATYDSEALTYDEHDIPMAPTHAHFVERLMGTCPPDGTVLDAPCGTGRYFALVQAAGRRVVGADQSAGMLAQARAKDIALALHRVGLQELTFEAQFDGVMTVDAMENVAPEDWPVVLANLHRAVVPGGHLYCTVEEVEERHIEQALADATARGLPVVRGEIVTGDTAGYHYYPGRERVARWLAAEGLEVVEEGYNSGQGYGYHHLLVRSQPGPGSRARPSPSRSEGSSG